MDSINQTNLNRSPELVLDQNAGEAVSVPSPKTGMMDPSAAQAAFSQFQAYRLSQNQGSLLSGPLENATAPQSLDFTSWILNALRAISENFKRATGTAGDQPIPVGFEAGPHWITGWGYKFLANNAYYADDATAQRLASALGAKVVRESPIGAGQGSAQAPDAATLQFPGGQKINAGVLANLLDRGYSRDYVESQLSKALTENGVTGVSIDAPQLYPSGPAGS
jgi:hypothetical protein